MGSNIILIGNCWNINELVHSPSKEEEWDLVLEKLNVYNKANEYVDGIYLLTKTFPKDEMFGLAIQLRSSAVAIPVNIAEGSAS